MNERGEKMIRKLFGTDGVRGPRRCLPCGVLEKCMRIREERQGEPRRVGSPSGGLHWASAAICSKEDSYPSAYCTLEIPTVTVR